IEEIESHGVVAGRHSQRKPRKGGSGRGDHDVIISLEGKREAAMDVRCCGTRAQAAKIRADSHGIGRGIDHHHGCPCSGPAGGEPRPLKCGPTVRVWAGGLITTRAAPVPAEPVGGTSFEPTSWVTNRSCACEAGTNRHAAPMKARSSEAHLIAVARRKQFMSSLPTAPWQLCRGSTPKLP